MTSLLILLLSALSYAQAAQARNDPVGSGEAPGGATMVVRARALATLEAMPNISSEREIGMTTTRIASRPERSERPEHGQAATDMAHVSRLDQEFQAAVKSNDVSTIDRILHDDFVLVLGNGTIQTRAEAIAEARSGEIEYFEQDEVPGTQVVRIWGDTAVVTAKLRIRGRHGAASFNRALWFSDTYVRTPKGWRYAFGQASLPLPGG